MRLRCTELLLIATVGFALIASAGCTHIRVSADYDPMVNFASYRTFDWIPGPQKETGNVRIDNPLLVKRIRRAVDQQLQIQGYTEGEGSKVDFLLGHHLSLERRLQIATINDYYGYGYRRYGYWGGSLGMSRTYVNEYEVGTLILDVVDGTSNELVWRGSGESRVRDESTPQEADRNVARVVEKILRQFPPIQ